MFCINRFFSKTPFSEITAFQSWKRLLSSLTVGPQQTGRRKWTKALSVQLTRLTTEIEHELTLLETVTPEPEDWQETTLRRLEAWIEERERLIAELERRIGSEATTAI